MTVTLRAADREAVTRLPDGRLLARAEWGPPGGPPVLLCPGAATSRLLGMDAQAVDAAGVLLVSFDRPGLGGSTHDPGRTLTSWAADVAHVVAQERWPRPVGIGFSQGGPFALALAAAGTVSAVALVSAQDELSARREDLDEHLLGLVDAVAADPSSVERSMATTVEPVSFVAMVREMNGGADRLVYEERLFAEYFSAAVREALRGGAEGYARDLVLTLGAWPFRPEDITMPVHLWYGALDDSPVHSPDHGARLAARIPNARRTIVEGEGGAILWTRTAEILADLGRMPR
ncbi:alpha/beta hydrolase [Nocardioides sp. LMS-CY]|nr:alpha/beta hydrolase [Nocardioides sp. LMS-CY]QWF22383.1 alpha/beta hydrolase [Nocardioides sp. LMS-CY]